MDNENKLLEQLFLVEAVVDELRLQNKCYESTTCTCNFPPYDSNYPLRVRVKFINFPCFEIEQENFSRGVRKEKGLTIVQNFSSGKSCLFPMAPLDLVRGLKDIPVAITVFQRHQENSPAIVLGICRVIMPPTMMEAVQKSTHCDVQLPINTHMAAIYPLYGPGGRDVGEIHLFIRLTCFGQSIVTQFQLVDDCKSFLFKNSCEDTGSQCKKCVGRLDPACPVYVDIFPGKAFVCEGEDEEEEGIKAEPVRDVVYAPKQLDFDAIINLCECDVYREPEYLAPPSQEQGGVQYNMGPDGKPVTDEMKKARALLMEESERALAEAVDEHGRPGPKAGEILGGGLGPAGVAMLAPGNDADYFDKTQGPFKKTRWPEFYCLGCEDPPGKTCMDSPFACRAKRRFLDEQAARDEEAEKKREEREERRKEAKEAKEGKQMTEGKDGKGAKEGKDSDLDESERILQGALAYSGPKERPMIVAYPMEALVSGGTGAPSTPVSPAPTRPASSTSQYPCPQPMPQHRFAPERAECLYSDDSTCARRRGDYCACVCDFEADAAEIAMGLEQLVGNTPRNTTARLPSAPRQAASQSGSVAQQLDDYERLLRVKHHLRYCANSLCTPSTKLRSSAKKLLDSAKKSDSPSNKRSSAAKRSLRASSN